MLHREEGLLCMCLSTDDTRKDASHLFQENLFLKKERQQLLERVASLEGRLSQLITLHSTEQVRKYQNTTSVYWRCLECR